MSADELKKREEAEGAAGNKEQGFDTYDEATFGKQKDSEYTDTHGDKVRSNYNADEPEDEDEDNRADVQNREQKPDDSYYKEGSRATRAREGLAKRFALLGKKYGASGGIMGILGVGMIVISVTLSPAALFATIEKSVTNDGSDFSRTNSAIFRAYRGSLIGGGECTGSKLKCKFVTATKKQMFKWVENRFKVNGILVDADGKQVSGGEREIKPDEMKDGWRAKIMSVVFPNGFKASSNADFEKETNRSVESRRWGLRVVQDKAGPFFTAKFNKVLSKYGLSKGVIAKKDSKPPETEEQKRALVDDEKKKAQSKIQGGIEKVTKTTSIASAPAAIGCTVYNTLRIVVGAVKAKHIADIVKFAFPFVQFAAKLADGSVTDKDFGELEGRANQLVWYPTAEYTKELADKEEDPEKKQMILEKQDLTATDSQGLRMAMYGDTSALTSFAQAYTTGGLASVAKVSSGIKEVQDAFGGQENVRTTCVTAQKVATGEMIAQAVACFGPQVALCILKAGATAAAFMALTYIAVEYGTDLLIKALATADIPSDLRGVDAGNALAAGIGLMLSRTSRGYGMKPAKSIDEVREFIAMTDDTYNKNVTELAKVDAQANPFDLYNEYSFVGVLNRSLNPYMNTGEKTGFAAIANMFSVVSNSLNPSASAIYSQPSLMTNTEENLKHRLNALNGDPNKCPDTDKEEIGVVCDWSGRMVGVTSKQVLEWANQMADGDVTPLYETIDYMQQQGNFKDIGNKGEGDGGTFDDTCNNLNNVFAAIFAGSCDDSRLPSIKEDGTVVEKSQYERYKRYCTEDRELEIGSADEAVEAGSDKDQDWITGKQCAKDSEMMDRFAFFFNMCEGQYAMANDATDCVDDGAQSLAATTPSDGKWVVPTSGPCLSPYGPRWGSLHAGIDISPPSGTPIVAPTDMTITGAEYNSGGYGNMITAKADDGTEYSFRFGHMLSNSGTVGAKVKKGEEIGKVGSTGDSSGPHLHFEVFPPGGNPASYSGAIDPVPVLAKNGVSISCG